MGVETIAGLAAAVGGSTMGQAAIAGAGTAIGSGLASSLMGQNKQPPPEIAPAPTGGSGMGAAAAQARGAANQGGNMQFPASNGPDYANGIDSMGDEQVAALIRMLLGRQQ